MFFRYFSPKKAFSFLPCSLTAFRQIGVFIENVFNSKIGSSEIIHYDHNGKKISTILSKL